MNIGLIGAGYWGKNLIRNLVKLKEVKRLVICDRQQSILDRIRDDYPAVTCLTDTTRVIQNDDLEAVFVVTSPGTHYQLGKEVLESGKHLYMEKPFAISANEAQKLVELAESRQLKIMSGHTFLYSPPVQKVKEIIASGEIGTVEFISFRRINLGIHQQEINVLWDLLPHDLSMILYWLGPDINLTRGQAFLKTSVGKHPDVGSVYFEFDNGCMAEGLVSWLSPKKIRETIIVGSRKMVVYNDIEPEEKIKIYDKTVEMLEPANFGEYQLTYRVGDVVSPRLDAVEPLYTMVSEFIDAINGKQDILSNGRFALKITRMIEQIIN